MFRRHITIQLLAAVLCLLSVGSKSNAEFLYEDFMTWPQLLDTVMARSRHRGRSVTKQKPRLGSSWQAGDLYLSQRCPKSSRREITPTVAADWDRGSHVYRVGLMGPLYEDQASREVPVILGRR